MNVTNDTKEEDIIESYTGSAVETAEGDTAGELSKSEKEEMTRLELFDWMQCIVFAIVIAIFAFVFFGRTIGVEGESMRTTLNNNDRVIISNFLYTPRNGDIVVFQPSPEDLNGTPFVKRVIAVGGQTIRIDFETGDVFVADSYDSELIKIDEPYVFEGQYFPEQSRIRDSFRQPLEIQIPPGQVFVMGDNRNHSTDSRVIGTIDERLILGRVLFVFMPGTDWDGSRDWSRIGPIRK